MNRRILPIGAAVLAAILIYGIVRLETHGAKIEPAIVTPQMDAQQAVSPTLIGRIKRAINERVDYNRTDRPKLIALTFDDGPYPVTTPLLLDELQALHVPATFFLIGRDAEEWPELAKRIRDEGNEIADHTLTHPNLDEESAATVRGEILDGASSLYRLTGAQTVHTFFRPPHGRYTVETIETAQSLGYKTILWTDDPGDWRTVTPQALATHMEEHATAPEIVLLHSGKVATVEMLPEVVARFKAAGYRFVTVGRLLEQVTPKELNHPAKRAV